MRAIISHDINHVTVFEHLFKDTVIPAYMARMHIELVNRKISGMEYMLRWADVFKNKWQNIDELITFNNVSKVPSSFFIAINNGGKLNYSATAALLWVEQMKNRHCEIGLQGTRLGNFESIKKEFQSFARVSPGKFGIRTKQDGHPETFYLFDKAGYAFDSSEYAFRNPYKIGRMWEFPLQAIDEKIMYNGKKWQSLNIEKAKVKTMQLVEKAHKLGLDYIGISFHDQYFSLAFNTFLNWYMWLVDYLRSNKITCVNFETAIADLEKDEHS